MEIADLFADLWDEERHAHPGYGWKRRGLRRPLGGERIGASLYELPPGKRTWPYHFHWANEELLLVLEGEATLRTPDGERQLRSGDCVVFSRGPEGAHALRNSGERPARLLVFSTQIHPDVGEYPDSRKLLAVAGAPPTPGEDAPLELLFRRDEGVDYWEGEP